MSEGLSFRVPAITPENLFWGAIALYPYFLKEGVDERGQMAIEAAHDLWNKAHVHVQTKLWDKHELERGRNFWSVFKKLTDTVEENDEDTAQGYFKAKYGQSYKTAKNFRAMLERNGIRVFSERLPGEISRSKVVRVSELHKVGDMMRTKQRERKKAARAKARVSQENRAGTRTKDSGTKPPEST
jgi:hypothetical protein